jgi:Leucine-rich repeat (LRR) protein
MQMLDFESICALARCNKSLKSDAESRFALATQSSIYMNSRDELSVKGVLGEVGGLLQYHPEIRVWGHWEYIKNASEMLLGNIKDLGIRNSIDRINGLKEVLASMRSLRKFTLLYGKLGTRTAVRLFKVLRERERRNYGLHELHIIMKTFGSDAMISLAAYLADAKSLEKLILISSTFKQDSFHDLATGIVQNKSIKSLSLSGSSLGSSSEIALAKILRECPTLTELDLSSVCIHFTSQQWNTVGSAIMDDNCNLQSLRFGFRRLSSNDYAIALAPLITKLHKLDLIVTNILDDGVRAIGRAIGASKTITHLCLSLKGDLKLFALAMASNKSLQMLDVDDCEIAEANLCHLKCALIGKSELRELHLAGNGITDADCQYVAEILIGCPSLEFLYLTSNNIGSAGIRTIAAALPRAKNLHRLHLAWNNRVDDESAAALFRAAYGHPSLSSIVISMTDNGFHIGELATPALEALKPKLVRKLNY